MQSIQEIEQLDLWGEMRRTAPEISTKVGRTIENAGCFSNSEKNWLEDIAEKYKDSIEPLEAKVTFFKAIKSGNKTVLLALTQIEK